MNDFHAELRAALAPLLNEPTPATEPQAALEVAPLTIAQMPPRRPWVAEVERDAYGLMTRVIMRPAESIDP